MRGLIIASIILITYIVFGLSVMATINDGRIQTVVNQLVK